jgi:hypothetical protein
VAIGRWHYGHSVRVRVAHCHNKNPQALLGVVEVCREQRMVEFFPRKVYIMALLTYLVLGATTSPLSHRLHAHAPLSATASSRAAYLTKAKEASMSSRTMSTIIFRVYRQYIVSAVRKEWFSKYLFEGAPPPHNEKYSQVRLHKATPA